MVRERSEVHHLTLIVCLICELRSADLIQTNADYILYLNAADDLMWLCERCVRSLFIQPCSFGASSDVICFSLLEPFSGFETVLAVQTGSQSSFCSGTCQNEFSGPRGQS